MKREIIPIQQTNEPILANYVDITADIREDVIYLNWTLYNNEDTYVNDGKYGIGGEDIELYNADTEFMWEYVATRLSINYI
jgi:transposase